MPNCTPQTTHKVLISIKNLFQPPANAPVLNHPTINSWAVPSLTTATDSGPFHATIRGTSLQHRFLLAPIITTAITKHEGGRWGAVRHFWAQTVCCSVELPFMAGLRLWAPLGRPIIWAPFQTNIIQNSELAHDWRKLLTALAQIPDNLRTHSFACKNLSLPASYFRLFQRPITPLITPPKWTTFIRYTYLLMFLLHVSVYHTHTIRTDNSKINDFQNIPVVSAPRIVLCSYDRASLE